MSGQTAAIDGRCDIGKHVFGHPSCLTGESKKKTKSLSRVAGSEFLQPDNANGSQADPPSMGGEGVAVRLAWIASLCCTGNFFFWQTQISPLM